MRQSIELYQRSLTLGELRTFLRAIPNSVPLTTIVHISVSPSNNHPTDPGGEITIQVGWDT